MGKVVMPCPKTIFIQNIYALEKKTSETFHGLFKVLTPQTVLELLYSHQTGFSIWRDDRHTVTYFYFSSSNN